MASPSESATRKSRIDPKLDACGWRCVAAPRTTGACRTEEHETSHGPAHDVVRRVDALFKLADAIEARVATATARADKLTQAVLAKALRGELVPTEAELARQEGRSESLRLFDEDAPPSCPNISIGRPCGSQPTTADTSARSRGKMTS